jgi:purine-binding chemotaxis protein CheW
VSRHIATFLVGETLLGLDILAVKEVYRHMNLTPIPGAPGHFCGLMNLRGKVVTVIDLSVCLDLTPSAAEEKRLLILKTNSELARCRMTGKLENVNLGEDTIGFLINRMEEVLTIEDDEILPVPSNLDILEKNLICGVVKLKNRLVILLDVTAVLEGVAAASTMVPKESGQKT